MVNGGWLRGWWMKKDLGLALAGEGKPNGEKEAGLGGLCG